MRSENGPDAMPTITVKCGCGKTKKVFSRGSRDTMLYVDTETRRVHEDIQLTTYTLVTKCNHCEQQIIADVMLYEAT